MNKQKINTDKKTNILRNFLITLHSIIYYRTKIQKK